MAVATHPVARDSHAMSQSHADITRDVVGTLGPATPGYVILLLGAVALFLAGVLTFLILIKDGLGHAGYNPPIFWSVYITTFVFWVGIGHAGTLISAILFLFRSPWRTAVYRSTEAMTVFAVMTAGLFPIIHIGRQWIFYWLLPYPNQRYLWPNFKSPLIWDVFAISTYFTVSATFLVFGMVLTLIIPLRRALRIEHMITDYHFDNLAKLTLLTGSILFYAYGMEYFVAWYSGNIFEQTTFYRRAFGPMWWAGWTMIICNAFVSQLLWFRKVRTNLTALFVISIFINIGIWFERYVIIVSSLSNDYIPWAWAQMNPTWADWGILAGSFGWFGMWFMLFAKSFPIVAIQEIKEMIPMPRRRRGHR